MDMRFVTSAPMIDSDLHLNGLCPGKTKKVPNEWLDSESSARMEYGACGNYHAKRKS